MANVIGPGFDFLRLALALSMVLFHSFQLTYGRSLSAGIFEPAVLLIVPAFFALSGFLVEGSMVRVRSVRTFIAFRALRIVPALAASRANPTNALDPTKRRKSSVLRCIDR